MTKWLLIKRTIIGTQLSIFFFTIYFIYTLSKVLDHNFQTRCNRPEYTPGQSIPGYIMA